MLSSSPSGALLWVDQLGDVHIAGPEKADPARPGAAARPEPQPQSQMPGGQQGGSASGKHPDGRLAQLCGIRYLVALTHTVSRCFWGSNQSNRIECGQHC